MDLEEKEVLLELKYSILKETIKLQDQIIETSPEDEYDQEFGDKIQKAIYYREILEKIELQLSKL